MSLIDINFLIKNISKDETIKAAKKYELELITKHMIELYELNLLNLHDRLSKTNILSISNELIHAGEALVGFKINLKNIKKSSRAFQIKYLGEEKKNIQSLKTNISIMKYISNKLFLHIGSVIKNPILWGKRNQLKKFLKEIS